MKKDHLVKIFLGLAAHLGLFSQALDAQIRFTNVSSSAGLSGGEYDSPSNHGLGVNWIDFDSDGWHDLFVVGGSHPPRLFHNQQDGTFANADELLPAFPAVEMSGSRFADYDGDGDQDIFIYTDNDDWQLNSLDNLPDGPANLLLKNLWVENGLGQGIGALASNGPLFEQATASAGVEDLAFVPFGDLPGHRAKTAAWLDYDRDGCIDLFVGHLVMNALNSLANRDRLYRNRCDGTFEDATLASGIGATPYRPALASGAFHLNEDLWPDLYVVNVSSLVAADHRDLVYLNSGRNQQGAVEFVDSSEALPGVGDDSMAGMGIDVADVDLDGDWDLYITDINPSTLDAEPLGNVFYLGDPVHGLVDNTAPEAAIASSLSWGTNFFDMDHDGWEDLFVATYGKAVYRNNGVDLEGRASFTQLTLGAALAGGNSRGSAVADYDHDGDLDLAVINERGPLQLFRNDTTGAGHWLILEFVAGASNRDAIGTVVEITTGDVVRRRQVKGGSSAHSQDALTVHVGIGEALIVDRIRVRWPSGSESVLEDLSPDRYLRVVETLLLVDNYESGDLSGWVD